MAVKKANINHNLQEINQRLRKNKRIKKNTKRILYNALYKRMHCFVQNIVFFCTKDIFLLYNKA